LQEAKRGAALMVTPELVLSGYPPEDSFHRGFRRRIDEALARLADAARGIDLLVGYPEYSGGVLFNAAPAARRPENRELPQAQPAELPGLRREALLHAG
jgi:NAD+ synthase (glutamine-hydrolysing)